MKLNVIILGAGDGKRMKSKLSKVLHSLAGRPLVEHVYKTSKLLDPQVIHLVFGKNGDQLKSHLSHLDVNWVYQDAQLGTGHAVQQVLPHLSDDQHVLVLYGDVPLIEADALKQLVEQTADGKVGLLVATLDDPTGFGRVLRDDSGQVCGVVEHKDASIEQRQIKEFNTGIMAAPVSLLHKYLPQVGNDNQQNEYYLPDILEMAYKAGVEIIDVEVPAFEVQGVNSRRQLAALEREFQMKKAEQLMDLGVTLLDPARIDIRGSLETGQDVIIDVNVLFEGKVKIGSNSYIGPNCVIKDAIIGENSRIEANSIIDGAKISKGCAVGPFARLRPGADLKNGSKVGNFVEVKKALIGEGSKVNHLSYIGDSVIEEGVNVGAGTITCNYDGVSKHQTTIKSGAFIGSNTALVAPVTIGENATVAAGSTITKDVRDNELAVGRARQQKIEGWTRPKKGSK